MRKRCQTQEYILYSYDSFYMKFKFKQIASRVIKVRIVVTNWLVRGV